MTRLIDLTGQRFGRWKVLVIHTERVRYGRTRKTVMALWVCRCDCGTVRIVLGASLRNGTSTSCGCLQREKFIRRVTKHGMTNTRAFNCWKAMLQRCRDPNHRSYGDYGGRGITVCEDWRSFENFYADVGDPPPGMSLDRIDNDGNYEPGNCRWATPREQFLNQRPPKRKARRADLAEIRAYADALRRAALPQSKAAP